MTADPKYDVSALGLLTRIWCGLDHHALQRAVDYQRKHPGVRLGQALCDLALLDRPRIAKLLALQSRLRRGSIRDADVKALATFARDQAEKNAQGFEKLAALERNKRRRDGGQSSTK